MRWHNPKLNVPTSQIADLPRLPVVRRLNEGDKTKIVRAIYTDAQRAHVIELYRQAKYTYSQIAAMTKVHRASVANIIYAYNRRGQPSPSGRPLTDGEE